MYSPNTTSILQSMQQQLHTTYACKRSEFRKGNVYHIRKNRNDILLNFDSSKSY